MTGYNSIFRKVMLHELGHMFGLVDVPSNCSGNCGGQTARHSVMNSICNHNDTGNNLPLTPQACDNQSLNAENLYPASISPPDTCYRCDDTYGCISDYNGPETFQSCASSGCGDPCGGDPCCGDPCCGDPNCGQNCYEVCSQVCYECCTVYDDYGYCYW